jgi:hypothetical protein
LAVAIAYRAIQHGFDALFVTAAELIDDLSGAFRRGQLADALTSSMIGTGRSANLHDGDNQLVVLNLVDDAILPESDAPEVFSVRELDAPGRMRVSGERQQRCRDHLARLLRQLCELPLSGRRQDDAAGSHSAAPIADGDWRMSFENALNRHDFLQPAADEPSAPATRRVDWSNPYLPQNRLERNRSLLCRLGQCVLRVSQIGRILGRFQTSQVICRDDRRYRLTVPFDDHPFASVFGATEHIRKSILRFSDGHGGHRPYGPFGHSGQPMCQG